MSQLKPPYPLIREALEEARVIPFLGSGASLGGERPLPTAGELANKLARKTEFPEGEPTDLSKVAQYYDVVGGRIPLQRELHRIFDQDYAHSSLHGFLAKVATPLLIVTTNYDDLIESALRAAGRAFEVVIYTTDRSLGDRLLWWPHEAQEPREVHANKLDIDLGNTTVVYKMHGGLDRVEQARDQYVITEDDYIDFLARMIRNKAIPSIFAEAYQTRHFLFLGYGLRDWNLRVVLSRIEKDLRRPKDVKSWAILSEPSPLEQRFWQERGVEVYDMTVEEFVSEIQTA